MKPGSLCGDFPVLGAAEQAALQEDGRAFGFGRGLGLVTWAGTIGTGNPLPSLYHDRLPVLPCSALSRSWSVVQFGLASWWQVVGLPVLLTALPIAQSLLTAELSIRNFSWTGCRRLEDCTIYGHQFLESIYGSAYRFYVALAYLWWRNWSAFRRIWFSWRRRWQPHCTLNHPSQRHPMPLTLTRNPKKNPKAWTQSSSAGMPKNSWKAFGGEYDHEAEQEIEACDFCPPL